MKTIKCDRCGKDIPYVPSFMNVAKEGVIFPKIIIATWNALSQNINEVDLCDDCQRDVYAYIFDYGNDDGA